MCLKDRGGISVCVSLVWLIHKHEKRSSCVKDMGSWPWRALIFLTPACVQPCHKLPLSGSNLSPSDPHHPYPCPSTASDPWGNKQNNQPDLSDTKLTVERSSLSGMTGISFSLLSFSLQVGLMERKVYWLWRLATETSQALCSKLSEVKSRSILFIFLCSGVLSTRAFA